MTNPLQLSRSQFYHYIHMTYLRCLSCCFYCPDVWLQFAEFEFSFDRENAKKVLEKAIAAIPESVLLRFGCCDFFEQHEMFEECENYYKQCIEEFKEPIIWIKYMRLMYSSGSWPPYTTQYVSRMKSISGTSFTR